MPAWLIFSIIPAFLLAVVNHTDKYLVDKLFKGRGVGALIIFSSLVGLPVSLVIFATNSQVIHMPTTTVLFMVLNGFFYVGYVLCYLHALQLDEASVVVPLMQLSSAITLIFGALFLRENISLVQTIGCAVILLGSIVLSLDFGKDKRGFKTTVFLLMMLCNVLVALNAIIFKQLALEQSFIKGLFWENVGMFMSAIPLFTITAYRKQFLKVVRESTVKALAINSGNELINVGGMSTLNYATLLAPVGLVYFVSGGFQPVFVLIIGILLTLFIPKISQENLEKKVLTQKIIAIIVIVGGTYLLSS